MQRVMSTSAGLAAGSASPRGLSSFGSSATGSQNVSSLGQSSLFGRALVRVKDLAACPKINHDARRKGAPLQVRASSCSNRVFSLSSFIDGILKIPGHKDEAVVYSGVTRISKKRIAVGNLIQSDLVDFPAAGQDKAGELIGKKIEIQLVSNDLDKETKKPKLSATSTVEGWVTDTGDFDGVADDDTYSLRFSVPIDFGEIGAFVIRNNHAHEFFLKDLQLQGPDKSIITFKTLAWVHPDHRYPKDRVFFSTKLYLPSETPPGLKALREQELEQYRGDGTGKREQWDRIYDYDVYNDYGQPDKNPPEIRAVLGGSKDLPYPRRIRTGRPMSKTDPKSESRLSFEFDIPYIPSDEFFLRTKNSTFIAVFLKSFFHSVWPAIKSALGEKDFASYQDIYNLYKDGLPIRVPSSELSSDLTPELDGKEGTFVYLSTIFAPKGDDKSVVVYPVPQLIQKDKEAWCLDEEFGRETLAGLHAPVIEIVKEYPPKSSLDPAQYGKGTSLTDEHILPYLEGLSVKEAIKAKRLFTIDYHDVFLPYIAEANTDAAGFKSYAPRAIFFHTSKGQMIPVAIELSLPPTAKGADSVNTVFTPADADDKRWLLAKIHFTAIDSNFHQVYSHFTCTHAVIEPFIIASNRQLSQLHPVRMLLEPHFKDTMNINAGAREILITSGGVIETSFSLGTKAMKLGAVGYGALWRFDQQSPPASLLARGMAEPADASHPGSVKLVVDDYPWAKDALDIWDALYKWNEKYLTIVYGGSDDAVKSDSELQAWWHELVNVGHGDLKDRSWWPKADSIKSVANIVSTIGWIAGPYHASLNFGQFAYGGFPPDRPTGARKFIPEKDSADYKSLQQDTEKFLLTTINNSSQATSVMTILELLATHSVDEEYIGSLSLSSDWSTNRQVASAFRQFQDAIANVEENIKARNKDTTLVNRTGPAQLPYTLLFPTSTSGLTGRGVPYSTSI